MSDVRVKDLELTEIDNYISLLNRSVDGNGDNRLKKRVKVQIPLIFYIKSIKGTLIEDPNQPTRQSYVVDISQDGAGVVSGRRMKNGDVFIAKGNGENKKFVAILKVVNFRPENSQFRYGCTIEKFTLLKK